LCAVDFSKAQSKPSRSLHQVDGRNLPVALLDILENWFKNCV